MIHSGTLPVQDILTGELPEDLDLPSHVQNPLLTAEVVWEPALCDLYQPDITHSEAQLLVLRSLCSYLKLLY